MKTDTRSLRILVVDDDVLVADVFKGLLKFLGHETVIMSSPLKALDLMAREKFDLALVDFRMPEMNGIEFIQKAQEFINKDRLWLLTGDVFSCEVEGLRKRGDIHLLEKPLSLEKLQTLIDCFRI